MFAHPLRQHNPTGALPSAAEFAQLVELCDAAGCYLLVDEMYRGLEHVGPAARLPAVCDAYAKGISLAGLSKTVGLPGLRLGWLVSRDDEVMKRVGELKDYTTICPAAPSEVLGFIALRDYDALLARSRAIVASGLELARGLAERQPAHLGWLEPKGGPFAYVRLHGLAATGGRSADYCEALRRRGRLMLVPGELFDVDADPSDAGAGAGGAAAQHHVRVCYGRRNVGPLLERWEGHLLAWGVGG